LCMRRSSEFIVAALGIFNAGGVYVPIDPDYPINRVSMLLSDSGTQVVITHSSLVQQLPTGNWRTVVLDAAGTATACYPRTTPDALRDWMVAKGITISFLPTALAQHMLELTWPPESALRVLLTGADTLHRYPPAGLPFAFVNNYGPTECTVVTTSGTVPSISGSGELPTIGSPIDNVKIYIVDEHMQAVPAGTPGELLIGGAGVARGYLNLPELNTQKFIADPFSKNPEARLYRTGDLARHLPNGEIAFMGRIDDQIKIRGYRIEPEEVMAVLNSHPDVKASMVVANGPSRERRLVAYVVPGP